MGGTEKADGRLDPRVDMCRPSRGKDQEGKGAEGLGRVWTVVKVYRKKSKATRG